jgi:hypothetical protein
MKNPPFLAVSVFYKIAKWTISIVTGIFSKC